MPVRKRLTPEDTVTARRVQLDGLARDADIFDLVSELAPRHRRVAWWQTDDFWQYALFAAVAYVRAAATRAGVPARQACQDLAGRPGQPAP